MNFHVILVMDVAFGIQKIVVIKVHIRKKISCQSLFSLHDIEPSEPSSSTCDRDIKNPKCFCFYQLQTYHYTWGDNIFKVNVQLLFLEKSSDLT